MALLYCTLAQNLIKKLKKNLMGWIVRQLANCQMVDNPGADSPTVNSQWLTGPLQPVQIDHRWLMLACVSMSVNTSC